MNLTARRHAFIEEYLTCLNATEAARRAGYKHPNKYGPFLVKHGIVQEHIAERLAEKAMAADETLARMAQQARAEWTRFLRSDGTIDMPSLLDAGLAHLIKGTRWDTKGRLIVEFHDAQAALFTIARHLGLFTERVELSGMRLNVTPEDAAQAHELLRQFRERMKAADGDNGNG